MPIFKSYFASDRSASTEKTGERHRYCLLSILGTHAFFLMAEGAAATPYQAAPTVINAVSCSFNAVQAATALAHLGDTVIIPAGNCDWTDKQLSLRSGIKLKGAGPAATILRRTVAVPPNTYLIRYDCSAGGLASFSGISLVGSDLPASEERGLGLINGCVDFVVSNARFTRFVFAGIEVRGPARQRGVIFNSHFIDNYNSTVRNLGYGIVVYGDGSWPALELGSENAVFIEDNFFSGNRHHIASNNGSRYVFRRNTGIANDRTKDFPQIDAHGLSSATRGSRSWEIYHNRFSAKLAKGRNLAAIGMRGGDGVIHNNTYADNIAHPVLLSLEGGPCGSRPVKDQIRSAYISEKAANAVFSKCPASVRMNRDFHLGLPGNYRPYTYPHPLRQQ